MAREEWATLGRLWGGGALILVALFMLLGFSVSGGAASLAVNVAALLITVGIPGVAGGWLVSSHFRLGGGARRRIASLRRDTIEAEIIKLAARRDGRLTAVEVAGELGVPGETAKEFLESLMIQGLADIEVTDSGVLVYAFHDIQHLGEKADARGVLDAGPDLPT